MRIRLLKPYQLSPAGEYLDPAPGIASQLIARGIAEKAEPDVKRAKPQAVPGTAPHRRRAHARK